MSDGALDDEAGPGVFDGNRDVLKRVEQAHVFAL
jgi:hypothetical protein